MRNIGIYIVGWFILFLTAIFLWPVKITLVEYPKHTYYFDDNEIIIEGSVLGANHHKNHSWLYKHYVRTDGTHGVQISVTTDRNKYESIVLLERNLTTPIKSVACLREFNTIDICETKERKPLYKYSNKKNQNHDRFGYSQGVFSVPLRTKGFNWAPDITYRLLLSFCEEEQDCKEHEISGELPVTYKKLWEIGNMNLRFQSHLTVPILIVVIILFIIPVIRLIKHTLTTSDADGWMRSMLSAIVISPIAGVVMAALLSSSSKGVDGYSLVYGSLILTPLSFAILLFLMRRLFKKKINEEDDN